MKIGEQDTVYLATVSEWADMGTAAHEFIAVATDPSRDSYLWRKGAIAKLFYDQLTGMDVLARKLI